MHIRICAPAAIESMAEIKMPGIAHTTKGYYILWGCAKLVTYLTTIR